MPGLFADFGKWRASPPDNITWLDADYYTSVRDKLDAIKALQQEQNLTETTPLTQH